MSKDLYAILGVEKDADDKTIQQAYRKLVRQYHPDTSTDDDKEENEDTMKEVNVAYEILSDAEKRQRYDLGGLDNLRGNDFGAGFNPIDLRNIFGGASFGNGFFDAMFNFSNNQNIKGSNVVINLEREVSASWSAENKEIVYTKYVACGECEGSGAEEVETCSHCQGTGRHINSQEGQGMRVQNISTCNQCGGSGQISKKQCDNCDGKGVLPQEESVTIDIPIGTTNNRLIMQNAGNHEHVGGQSGDLIVQINVYNNTDYEIRNGNMLIRHLPIPVTLAILGGEHHISHPIHEDIVINVPQGVSDVDYITVNGMGLPPLHGTDNLDLIVDFKLDIPKGLSLTEEQTELLQKLQVTGL